MSPTELCVTLIMAGDLPSGRIAIDIACPHTHKHNMANTAGYDQLITRATLNTTPAASDLIDAGDYQKPPPTLLSLKQWQILSSF